MGHEVGQAPSVEPQAPSPHPRPRRWGRWRACGARPASWVAVATPVTQQASLRPEGSAAEVGRARDGLPAYFADLLTRGATGPSLPRAITRTRRPPRAPGPRGGRARGRGWNSSQGPLPPSSGALAPAPRAPPSRPPANCMPPGPARSHMPPQGMPGLAGGGRALGRAGPGRAGPGRERPAGKAGEREAACPHPPRPPAPPLRPARVPSQPDRGTSHFPRSTLGRDDPRAQGLERGRSARLGQPPLPSARPLSPPARRRGQAVMFPHTPPCRRRLWGPGGEQGAD